MSQLTHKVLTINGGSASIKFALSQVGEAMQRILAGKIECIGLSGSRLSLCDAPHAEPERISPALLDEQRVISDYDPDHLAYFVEGDDMPNSQLEIV